MEIKKIINKVTSTYTIELNNDGKIMQISFAGCLDLFWSIYDKQCFSHKSIGTEKTFEITKENYTIYSVFDKLYNDIVECNIFDDNDYYNSKIKESEEYASLFDGKSIKFISDDAPSEEANYFEIDKLEDSYEIKFFQNENKMKNYAVRISNSGSRYKFFCILFANMFKELQTYDSNNHQIHMYEYMYQKRLEPNKKTI